jgi:nucleoside-diphosphate-sugar epimerase
MTQVLITGAKSFVGANFRKFSQFTDIDEVSLYDKKPEDIEFGKYDTVLHLAAIVHQSTKISEEEYFKINKDLCLRVALAAKKAGIRQFIFLSTVKVYGDTIQGSGLRNEDSPCYPDDAYGMSKYAAESELKKLADDDFTVSIIRTPLVYGEGAKANMRSLVKLVFYLSFLPLDKIENKRNITFAENLVGFIDRIIEKRASGVFIAMDEKSISTSDLIRLISNSFGKRTFLFTMPKPLYRFFFRLFPETMDRLYNSLEFDNTKTKKELDYKPPFSTEEGIKKMIEFYIAEKKSYNRKVLK